MNARTLAEQVVQIFDSWAHTLTPEQFSSFSLPYAQKVIDGVREKRPDTPLMFHANGGEHSVILQTLRRQLLCPCNQHLQYSDLLHWLCTPVEVDCAGFACNQMHVYTAYQSPQTIIRFLHERKSCHTCLTSCASYRGREAAQCLEVYTQTYQDV